MGSDRQQSWIEVTANLLRSDNSVKNHFYSRLRKGLRKVNLAIKSEVRKEMKEFKPNVLYRIVEVA